VLNITSIDKTVYHIIIIENLVKEGIRKLSDAFSCRGILVFRRAKPPKHRSPVSRAYIRARLKAERVYVMTLKRKILLLLAFLIVSAIIAVICISLAGGGQKTEYDGTLVRMLVDSCSAII